MHGLEIMPHPSSQMRRLQRPSPSWGASHSPGWGRLRVDLIPFDRCGVAAPEPTLYVPNSFLPFGIGLHHTGMVEDRYGNSPWKGDDSEWLATASERALTTLGTFARIVRTGPSPSMTLERRNQGQEGSAMNASPRDATRTVRNTGILLVVHSAYSY